MGKTKPRSGNLFFVTLPYKEVKKSLDFIRTNRLGIEIAAHDTNWLLNIFNASAARKLGIDLEGKGTHVRAAGPIFDMNPGSLDHVVRQHTGSCYLRAVEMARAIGSSSLVVPSGFNPLLPGDSVAGWRELSLDTWIKVGEAARHQKIEILIKNIFDPSPEVILQMLEALRGLPFGFCLDVGHASVYSTIGLRQWLKSTEEWIREVHLHDNLGSSDDHLPLGEGIIDFRSLFTALIRQTRIPPFTLDLETGDALKSLVHIERHDLLGQQLDLL